MLRVVYKTADLAPGILSDWREDRGFVEIRIARGLEPVDFIPSLNETLLDFVTTAQWFQIWEGEVVSAASPLSPLRVTFELSPLKLEAPVEIREHKGYVALLVHPLTSTGMFIGTLNRSIEEFLAGGQWFQLWHGEIVTMDSPEANAA
jgi:hypothetical protein